ncbi:MAG: M23 family metallopeptidase [candidate division WOR-3 bacterium]|nr:M23 family metallopeptidase [candidate division WOR-3 bacterium]
MKKRKLKISVIPHGSEDISVKRFFIVLIPIVLIAVLGFSVYLTVITVNNIRNIKDYAAIRQLREDVAVLTIKNRESQQSIERIEEGIEDIKGTTASIIPSYEYISGIINTSEQSFSLPDSPDSLLSTVSLMRTAYDSFYNILSNQSYADKIPSLIPVSGWVLREYGYVNDPYTETRRLNPGILFVVEENKDVYAAADGYVLFAGNKPKLGKTVIIKHSDNYITTYAHLSGISITSGKTVSKGDIIGYAGKTGKTLSSALYYEIKRNEENIDPSSSFMVPVYMLYDSLRSIL